MKNNLFAAYFQQFFKEYLLSVLGCSSATITSYREVFLLFFTFCKDRLNLRADRLTIDDYTYDNVVSFLAWLEESRGNSVSTRNQRLAALKTFARFLMYEYPDNLNELQLIVNLKQKKAPQPIISYIKADETALFLKQIDRESKKGQRDYALFSLMFTTGIRVSEVIGIKAKDICLENPRTIKVHGKGNKTRQVPIVSHVYPILKDHIESNQLNLPKNGEKYLFTGSKYNKLTRQNINYLVNKYKRKANEEVPGSIPEDFSPHKIRHSAAMSLMESDVELVYIRDLLGHSSVTTTEVYAKTDSRRRREAIEKASKPIITEEQAEWDNNPDLIDWLKSFNR